MADHHSIPRALFRLTPHFSLYLLAVVSVGILATQNTVALWMALGLSVSLILGVVADATQRRGYIILLFSLITAYAYAMLCMAQLSQLHLPANQLISFTAKVDGIAQVRPEGYAYDLRILQTGQHVLYRTASGTLHWGDTVAVTGTLRVPPFPTNPGQLDYRQYLMAHGYSATLTASRMHVLYHGWQFPLDRLILSLRQRIVRVHAAIISAREYQSLFTGLIFGQLAPLDSGKQAQFQKAGLLHLLVASGAQVSLLAGILATACRMFALPRLARWAITVLMIAVFCGMSGGGVAIFRASLMAITALTLQLGFRKAHPLHVLAVTGLVVLVLHPASIWDVGAQLSFAATAGLVVLSPAIAEKLPGHWPNLARSLIATTLAPYLATLPILWLQMHTLSLVSILSNLVVLAWLEMMVTVGFFLTVLGLFVQPLSVGIGLFCELALVLLDRLTAWFAALPGGQFYTPSPPLGLALGLYVVLGIGLWLPRGPWRARLIGMWAVALGLWFAWVWIWPQPLRLTMVDVGQGDCLVVQTPHHRVLVFDSGGVMRDQAGHIWAIANRTVLPFLRHEGINRIDLLLLSHYHQDHIGGNQALADAFPIGLVIDRGGGATSEHQKNLSPAHYCVTTSATFQIEPGVVLEVRHPAGTGVGAHGENDHSLVAQLRYGDSRFLLMGDLEADGEERLLADPGFLRADVLKVGHHGSKTSSTPVFLDVVKPQIALVSVGAHNLYRHPSAEVMNRLKTRGAAVMRTDRLGAITLETDGRRLHAGPAMDTRSAFAQRLSDAIADLVGL